MPTINSIEELYNISRERLENQQGTITINFANRSHVYTGNDVIGNCLQEWLPEWFRFIGANIQQTEQTQAFPDFTAYFNDLKYDVEIKAWHISRAPAFDIANFYSFLETTYDSPSKLDAYYIILGYEPAQDGFSQGFIVRRIFLKKIWEITGPSDKHKIKLQVKRNQPYALRPSSFHTAPENAFRNRDEFIQAVYEAYKLYPNEAFTFTADEWLERVQSYTNQ